ncbi:MAG: 2-oxo acid dehydrogenase subunit E2, partial [Bdellovibrionaceae bacterium]|nr:2-oxo acid dehydrogenase subunit E2 [Pseudobdellovibrionaceae bacterium]
MNTYTVNPCNKLYALNKTLVEREINFNRTVHFLAEIDLTEIDRVRKTYPPAVRPSYTTFIAKAVAQALKEYPYANRRLFRFFGLPFFSFFQNFTDTDVAIAIETAVEGQNATAYMDIIRDVQNKSLDETAGILRRFATDTLETSEQWRMFYNTGTRLPSWLSGWVAHMPFFFPRLWKKYRGGAVMISSPAKYGVDGVVAAWTHPLSFSFGLAQKKPMVKNDQVVPVLAFTFAMNWDR